eukprot:m51a1_g12689 putative protein kinase xa21 (547) ;mRNA; f:65-3349
MRRGSGRGAVTAGVVVLALELASVVPCRVFAAISTRDFISEAQALFFCDLAHSTDLERTLWTGINLCSMKDLWYCHLPGVTCAPRSNTVTGLNISGTEFNGTIPQSIGRLTQLTSLHISGDRVSGTIPDSIWHLPLLVSTEISHSGISGTVPGSIANCHVLEKLHLEGNDFSGLVPGKLCDCAKADRSQRNGRVCSPVGQASKLCWRDRCLVRKRLVCESMPQCATSCNATDEAACRQSQRDLGCFCGEAGAIAGGVCGAVAAVVVVVAVAIAVARKRRTSAVERSGQPKSRRASRAPADGEPRHVELSREHAGELRAEVEELGGKELKQFQRSLPSHFQMHHEDYNEARIKQGKAPLTFVVLRAWRVRNAALERWFEARRAYMRDVLGRSEEADELEERVAFHGTREENIEDICAHGLLRVGHPLNPSASTDPGFFGDPRCGVYTSRFVEYTLQYSNNLPAADGSFIPTPLGEGQTARIVMLKVLPGKSLHMSKLAGAVQPTPGFDSHSSPTFSEWFLFDETQCCPTHVIEVRAISNKRTCANDV